MPAAAWTDTTLMPWGAHAGAPLKSVPASYLLWLFEQTWIRDWPGLYLYLKAHEDQLMAEKKEQRGEGEGDDDPRTFEDYKNYR